MNCSISGTVPKHPVVCTKTGQVYEKELIEKHIQATGRDPVTNEEITTEDLVAIVGNPAVAPRPPTATSVSGLLSVFQSEWDAVMLETFNLKKTLDSTRQQLSHALYQHDAACRVIARLVKERDEARAALANAKVVLDSRGLSLEAAPAAAAASAGAGLTDVIIAELKNASKRLHKGRKKRSVPAELASQASITSYGVSATHTFHRGDKPGVTALAVHPAAPASLLTGGADHTAKVFDMDQGRVAATLSGHSKRITAVAWHPDASTNGAALTACKGGEVRVWSKGAGGEYGVGTTLSPHGGAGIATLDVHPVSTYALTTSSSAAGWSVSDIVAGVTLGTYGTSDPATTTAGLHPDGILFAVAGDDGKVRVSDLRTQSVVATFEDATAPLTALAFNENGYFMAGGGKDGVVSVFDLRNLASEQAMKVGGAVTSMAWDHSGSYIGVGAQDSGAGVLTAFTVKTWEQLFSVQAHKDAISCLQWGPLAASIVTGSADNTVAVWGAGK